MSLKSFWLEFGNLWVMEKRFKVHIPVGPILPLKDWQLSITTLESSYRHFIVSY